jgi:hypothetical protein
MDGAAILEIMDGIGGLDVDPVAKREFSNLVRGIGAAHGCTQIARLDRTTFARELLMRRVSRPTIRDRLIATFGVSRTHAYRIIDAALQLSQKPAEFETPIRSNGCID